MLVFKGGRIRLGPFAFWSVLFVLVHAASGLFIVESTRVITFARNLGAYVGATLWVLVLTNTIGTMGEARRVLRAACLAMVSAGLIGLMGIMGLWRTGFSSPMGLLLPESIRSTTYGGSIAIRTTGVSAWFVGLGDYFRVSSVFMFATFFATAIVVTLPVVFWLRGTAATRAARCGWGLIAALLLANLLFTTGRVAMVAFLAGAAWYVTVRRPGWTALLLTALTAGTVAAASGNGAFPSLAQEGLEAVAFARGTGSVDSRTQVYRSTVTGFLERPVLGWGTERDIPGQRYPAGSHSTYLGVLYKHGLLGFLCLVGMLVAVWRTTKPDAHLRGTDAYDLLRYGRWISITILLNGLTDVLDLDATTLMLVFVFLGTLVTVRSMARSHPTPASPPSYRP